jgi:hypothetical protein
MYPLRDAETKERVSGMRLRASEDDEEAQVLQADEPFAEYGDDARHERLAEPTYGERAEDLDDEDEDPFALRAKLESIEPSDSERKTLAPAAAPSERASEPRKSDPSEALSEVLFRAACGDLQGSLVAAEELMARVPVLLMTKEDLRSEPLGYWELHVLGQIDAMSSLGDLVDDSSVPPAEVVRVVCELVERKIIALR